MWSEIAELLLPYLEEITMALILWIIRRLEKGKMRRKFNDELNKRQMGK